MGPVTNSKSFLFIQFIAEPQQVFHPASPPLPQGGGSGGRLSRFHVNVANPANLFSSPTSRGGSLSPSVVRHIATPSSGIPPNSNVYNPDNPLAGVYSPKTSHVHPFFQPQIITTTYSFSNEDNNSQQVKMIQTTSTTSQRNSSGNVLLSPLTSYGELFLEHDVIYLFFEFEDSFSPFNFRD